MSDTLNLARTPRYGTAVARWAGVGPYYAMFPVRFANAVVESYSNPGDVVLDPFAGRGTAVFSAASQERYGFGVEIHPVGWVYANTKLNAAPQIAVSERIEEIGRHAWRYRNAALSLPEFFHYCFTIEVRQFLLAARQRLDWKRNRVDRTTMALLLVHLHGKRTDSLSNQMRQAKSMSPSYAIKWWKSRQLQPPEINPVQFILNKLPWRYAKGTPDCVRSWVYFGDCTRRLNDVARRLEAWELPKPKLLVTSPPYYGVTNYFYDQWLRLWLLGGPGDARRVEDGPYRRKFEHRENYANLLRQAFAKAAQILDRDAVVYVRTDSREITRRTTENALRTCFPNKSIKMIEQPVTHPTQTQLYGDFSSKPGEIDFVLR